ncbi:general secretion pathway protein GspN [Luteimonas sp. SX5]|uniref:General secretion pathway protein GspN n=1 Tax=Luteimonas galliterrae TaxID=2940486 RepID=A0ABT0MMR8_9GAMM|nr:general secretion pathway protein GspN [Luteimonas galliterrae]MCL1636191.1 general secretion pathway protein GspN [Luteimonas galliterrae]
MRADGIGVRTWLLAAIAGWALLVWILAIAGMGGGISPLPADAALAPQLPPAPSASRLVSHNMNEYGEATTRPLFFSDRRPKPFSLQPGGDVATQETFDYVLSSVLIAPGLRMAILQSPDGANSIRLKLGEASEKLPGWRLTELTPRSATIASATETRSLELRVFDGRNGQPPTAQPSVQSAAGAAQATMPVPPPPNPVPSPPMTPTPQPARTAAGEPAVPPEKAQSAAPPSSNEAQLQAIRQRIEARRAKLRQEAQEAAKPKN